MSNCNSCPSKNSCKSQATCNIKNNPNNNIKKIKPDSILILGTSDGING